MNKIKFDLDSMKFLSLFQSITHTNVKDCIVESGRMTFVVPQGEIGKAVGKNGVNVKKLEKALNRKIKIVEFNPEIIQFIKNLVYPLNVMDVTEEDGKVIITPSDSKSRGLLIGRNAQNLRGYEGIAKRYFKINELRVI